jgi:tRNA (guanine-N7-)-methyltransferase
MRNRRKHWTANELETNEYLINDPRAMPGRWRELFGADGPLYIEIGCGKGAFLARMARLFPDVCFIGIEKEAAVAASAVRMTRESGGLANLRFIVADARGLREFFAEGEVSRIYLNFSDPWAGRAKWHKRRLTHGDFLAVYEYACKPIEIFMKTDDKELFDFSVREFGRAGFSLSAVTTDLHNSEYDAGNVMTEYEEYFRSKGKPVCRLEARK